MSKFSKIIEDKIKLRQAKVDATEKEWLYQKERLRLYEEVQAAKSLAPTDTATFMIMQLITEINRDTNLDHNTRTGLVARLRDIKDKI
jgi:hypothetical protein